MDLLSDAAWQKLASEVEREWYHGFQGGPVCTSFSGVRGNAGGPPPLRGLGAEIYGLKDLLPAQKLQVEQDTLIAERVVWIAQSMHTLKRPF